MRLLNKNLFFVLLLFIATSCALVKPIEFKSINSFKVEEQTGTRGIVITTNVTLLNPNGFKFTINHANIDVIAEGVALGKLQIPDKITINSKDEFSGNFKVEISFTKLLLAGKNVISKLKAGEFEIDLKGTINANVLRKQKDFKVNYHEKIELN